MRWRGKIRHIRQRFRRTKACSVTPAGVTVLSCRATGSGVTRLNFQKIMTFQYNVGWRWFLYENCRSRRDLQLSSFEFFRLMTLRCSKNLYKVSTPKWSRISPCHIRKIIYFVYGFKWRYHLYQSCNSQWDLQLCSFEFLHLRLLRYSRK
jgi:cation diffusion facilitator CzcD-associated flavoprotein CzcO